MNENHAIRLDPTELAVLPGAGDEYEVLKQNGDVMFSGPLWAAMMFMAIEPTQFIRRLMPTGKAGPSASFAIKGRQTPPVPKPSEPPPANMRVNESTQIPRPITE